MMQACRADVRMAYIAVKVTLRCQRSNDLFYVRSVTLNPLEGVVMTYVVVVQYSRTIYMYSYNQFNHHPLIPGNSTFKDTLARLLLSVSMHFLIHSFISLSKEFSLFSRLGGRKGSRFPRACVPAE